MALSPTTSPDWPRITKDNREVYAHWIKAAQDRQDDTFAAGRSKARRNSPRRDKAKEAANCSVTIGHKTAFAKIVTLQNSAFYWCL